MASRGAAERAFRRAFPTRARRRILVLVAPDSQETVPYVDAVWNDGVERRVLVIAADDAVRGEVVAFLEVFGFQVAWARDAGAGAKLFARMSPHVVVADLETIAPDFEPLRPSLEALFGNASPRPVVILGTDDPRERVEWVEAAVPDPRLAGGREQLLLAIDRLAAPVSAVHPGAASGSIDDP